MPQRGNPTSVWATSDLCELQTRKRGSCRGGDLMRHVTADSEPATAFQGGQW